MDFDQSGVGSKKYNFGTGGPTTSLIIQPDDFVSELVFSKTNVIFGFPGHQDYQK